jgi:hypothetical protein
MNQYQSIFEGLRTHRIVPYIGPGALADARNAVTGAAMPADSNSLILAMNDGKPMAPKLMYEFPRAAMNLELKRGRSFVEGFLTRTYANTQWTRASLHDWLAELSPHYVIDINRDSQLQESYKNTPHLLIRGMARVAGTAYRFTLHHYDGNAYREIPPEESDSKLPILFKPMGSPLPKPSFIASDADYVDYITELMGGFAIPPFLKEYRTGLQYLLLGMPLNRDSERMVMSDITWGSAEQRGWVLNTNPTDKEKRYCERIGLEIIHGEIGEFLSEFQHSAQIETVAA